MWKFDSTGSLQRTDFWSSLCPMSSKAEPGGLRCKRDSQLLHRQQAKVSHPHEWCMLTTSSTKRAVKILSIQGWILAIHFSFFSRCLAFFLKWSKLKTILLWIKKKRKTWREKKRCRLVMLKGAEMSKRCGGVPHNRHTVLEAGTGLLYARFILLYKLRLLEAPLCQRVYLFKFILTFSFVLYAPFTRP